jgi:hypothetical protein
VVGARSVHERPAATITTTDEPETMMRALSHLSSSLKTVSPEQSFPTLRGHPPEIELGDSFDVPAAVADRRPETGVRLVVPPEYDYLYPVASLAFYLGARITPGSPPRLRTRDGFEYRLTEDGPFEDTVAGLLQQVLFLDCVVRTEGIYRLNLYERVEVEDRLPFDPAAVYELPPGPRLSRYLEIPYVELEPYLPRWGMTVHLPARPAGVEALPFVAANLGIVRSPRGRRTVFPDGTDDTTGGAPGTRLDAAARQPYIVPDRTDESVEHAWFADALPLDATKAMVAAYRNGLDRTPATEALHITVVCNDRTLARETEALDTVYGFREEFPFRIDSYRQLSVAALERVLRSDTHFLHYIGDAGGGLDCPDGRLDAATLEDVAVDTFLLNAPESAEQGMELIEAVASSRATSPSVATPPTAPASTRPRSAVRWRGCSTWGSRWGRPSNSSSDTPRAATGTSSSETGWPTSPSRAVRPRSVTSPVGPTATTTSRSSSTPRGASRLSAASSPPRCPASTSTTSRPAG